MRRRDLTDTEPETGGSGALEAAATAGFGFGGTGVSPDLHRLLLYGDALGVIVSRCAPARSTAASVNGHGNDSPAAHASSWSS